MLRKHSKVAAQWDKDNQSIVSECKQDGDFKQARQGSGSYWSKALELKSAQHYRCDLIISALIVS